MASGSLKLIIKAIDAPSIEGNKALALCTEDGEIVGKQIASTVESEVGTMGIITVRFYIDGDTIRFAANTE